MDSIQPNRLMRAIKCWILPLTIIFCYGKYTSGTYVINDIIISSNCLFQLMYVYIPPFPPIGRWRTPGNTFPDVFI